MTEGSGGGEIERRIVSVLFCDLAGFTSLSERLDAEDIATVQAAYFDVVRDAVGRHGGTLEKFIGDAAVAVYGMPVAREDDAQRAVRTGLAIVSAVEQLAGGIGLDEDELRVRVGVQTGEAVVHTAPRAGEALVTGDVVNTAARLQAAAPLGAVLVGADTALAIKSAVELEELGALDLKGKAAPVSVARVTGILVEPERERAMGGLRATTVGRDEELAKLAGVLEECARGRSARVTIVAPPGTGKSRILQEVAALAVAAGADVRTARVRPDGLAPYRPVAELVAAALGNPELDTDEGVVRRRLESRLGRERGGVVADELAVLLAGHDEPAAAHDAEVARTTRFGAWSDGLRALGEGSSEVWLVEDVHWATPDFRAFVSGAARQEGTRGRLVVSTSRPSLLESDADWIASGMLMVLDPLPDEAASELVRELVGDALDDELVRGIAKRSGGNPLFVEELLRTWVSTGLLEPADDGWRLRGGAAEIELPSTVQTIYAAQLDDLPAAARDLVRRASVAGRRFPVAALGSLGASEQGGLETLERRGIVRGPVSDSVLGESYVFRHALLREVGYASLSRKARSQLHVRMARWLEGVAHERPLEVAEVAGRHYAAALAAAPRLVTDLGDGLSRPEAARLASALFERAGEGALAIAAYDAAKGLFERALELTATDDEIDRAHRLVGLAQSIAFTSDMDAGLAAAEEALAIYRASFRAGEHGEVRRDDVSRTGSLVGRIYTQQLRFADAMELAADLLVELGERNDPATVRLLLLRIRGAGMISDEAWEEVAVERNSVRELAPALGDAELALEARMATAWDEADRRAAWTDIERLAHALRRWPAVAEARQALAGICLPDDLAGTREAAVQLVSFAAAHQLHESRAWGAYYVAEAEFAAGRWDEALDAGLLALELAEERGYQRAAARTWFAILPIAAARRDRTTLERAAAWYERLQSFPDSPYGRLSRTASDILLSEAGLPSTFRVSIEDLEPSIAEGGSLPSWFEAVDIVVADALANGRVEAAHDAVETFRGTLVESSLTGAGTLAVLEARVHVHEGRNVSSGGFVPSLREHGRPWPLLKCLRLLEGLGMADPGEAAEARALEAQLGL